MSGGTAPDCRIGMGSAFAVSGIAVVYVLVGFLGVAERPPGSQLLRQSDPYLAIMEALMILAAVALVVMMAAVYRQAPAERKTFGLTALAFTIIFAVLSCGVHFVSLTVRRQVPYDALPSISSQLSVNDWPTIAMAVDLLAWDFFLGLALLFAALVLSGDSRARGARLGFSVAGLLCLAATMGPATGRLGIQYLGIVGYACGLPISCALLGMFFRENLRCENDHQP